MAHKTYTLEQKQEAATMYAVLGSVSKVARKLDYPVPTVQSWSTDWDGWVTTVTNVQEEKAAEHRAKYSAIVDEAQKQTLAKLPEATAAQANIIAATATDKIRLLDNKPTHISGKADSIEALSDEFIKLARSVKEQTKAIENQQVINVIDVKDETQD